MDYGNENVKKGGNSLDGTIVVFLVLLIVLLGLVILVYDHGWELVFQSVIKDSIEAFVAK